MAEENLPKELAWRKMTDILRAQVYCRTPEEVKEVFKRCIKEAGTIQIMRIKPRFSGYLSDMIVNFNFLNQMICELQIKLGDGHLPRGYEEQHFIYELIRCISLKSNYALNDVFITRLKRLVHQRKIDADLPIGTSGAYTNAYPHTLQAALISQNLNIRDFSDE